MESVTLEYGCAGSHSPLKTHQQTMPNTPAKPALRIMKMMKDGNQKKFMRQMEAMKGKGNMPGF